MNTVVAERDRIQKQGKSLCSICQGFAASLLVFSPKNIPVIVKFCSRCDTSPRGRR